MWLGYLEEYPDYWTQGETEEELRENLLDIYSELTMEISKIFVELQKLKFHKRRDLISKLEEMGCIFVRHGGKHDWYQNPITKFLKLFPDIEKSKSNLQNILLNA